MEAKPAHLGPEYAAQFQDEAVVEAYRHRPPYPAQLWPTLLELIGPPPLRVLDLGCGPGEIARALAPHVDSVTAIDQSEGMVRRARGLPGGSHPRIEWLVGDVETTPLGGPYTVAVAAQSFHWFEWHVVVPRIVEALPSRRLVIIDGRGYSRAPWWKEVAQAIPAYSTNVDYQAYDCIEELTRRGLFAVHGDVTLLGQEYGQSPEVYVESIHSRNGFSRDRMDSEKASEFDSLVLDLVRPHVRDGVLTLRTASRVTWGLVRADT